jgi:hypothetical protein
MFTDAMYTRNAGQVVVAVIVIAVLAAYMTPKSVDQKVEQQVAWAQFTYDYSTHEWCVNAQRRDAIPGAYVGGCFKTLREAEEDVLK